MTTLDLPTRDLPRAVFAVLCITALLAATLWILRPFLPSIVWATLIVVATWPLLCRVQRWCGGRRWLAVLAMMGVLLLVFLLPIVVTTSILVGNAPRIMAFVRQLPTMQWPQPPEWLANIPGVGAPLAQGWRDLAQMGPEGMTAAITPYLHDIGAWFIVRVGGAGVLMFHVAMTLILAAVLYARGELAGAGVRRFARRLAGERGDTTVLLAATASRAVAFGVVVTALTQALAGGLGLLIAGVPAWAILTALMFLTSVAQIGAAPVLALCALWLLWQGSPGWAITIGVWTLVVGSLDNVLRPLLIGRGAHMPLLMVFGGVIGGLVAFGPIGLFVGPVVLVVSYTLLAAWVDRGPDMKP